MNIALTLGSFAFFTALVAAITWWKSRGGDTASNDGFFLAGRSLTFPFIAASLLLTNLSTEQLVGLNGQAFTTGLAVMMWEVVGVIAIVLMALWFLPKFLRSGITTVPELLDIRFGPRAQLVCNLLFMLAYMFILLPMILYTGATGMVGILDLDRATGLSDAALLWPLVWLIGGIGSCYALFGGLRSIVVSDLLNGIGLLVGGFMITFFGLWACGAVDLSGAAAAHGGSILQGLRNLAADIPEHLNSIGSAQPAPGHAAPQAPFMQIFTGIVLVNVFYWCTNQQIIQRTLAASSLKEGQKGVLLCGLLKLIGPLYLVLPGIMAYFLFRHGVLVPSSDVIDPATGLLREANAYGELVNAVLPPWLAGFFAAVMAGAVLSSFNSALNSTCTLFSLGIYKKLRPERPDAACVRAGKWFGLLIALASMFIAPMLASLPSIFGYLQKMNAIYFIPILAVVLAALLSPRVRESAAILGLVGGVAAISVGYFVFPGQVLAFGEYHFVGVCFLAILDLMLLHRLVWPSPTAHVFRDAKAVSLEPWKGAKLAAALLLLAILAAYAAFADFTVLKDSAGRYPFLPFILRAVPALLPTLLLFWLDRHLDRRAA